MYQEKKIKVQYVSGVEIVAMTERVTWWNKMEMIRVSQLL